MSEFTARQRWFVVLYSCHRAHISAPQADREALIDFKNIFIYIVAIVRTSKLPICLDMLVLVLVLRSVRLWCEMFQDGTLTAAV